MANQTQMRGRAGSIILSADGAGFLNIALASSAKATSRPERVSHLPRAVCLFFQSSLRNRLVVAQTASRQVVANFSRPCKAEKMKTAQHSIGL